MLLPNEPNSGTSAHILLPKLLASFAKNYDCLRTRLIFRNLYTDLGA